MAAVFVDVMRTLDVDGSMPCPLAIWSLRCIFFEGPFQSVDETYDNKHHLYMIARRRYPAVLCEIMRFLARPRNAGMMHALEGLQIPKQHHCTCSQTYALWSNPLVRDLHTIEGIISLETAFPSFSALQALLRTLFWTMATVLADVFASSSARRIARRARRHAIEGRSSSWPSCQEDILPYGIEISISALCAWSEFLPEYSHLRFIQVLYASLLEPVFPSILMQTIIPHAFIPSATRHVKYCKVRLEHGDMRQPLVEATLSFLLFGYVVREALMLDDRQILAAIGRSTHMRSFADVCAQSATLLREMLLVVEPSHRAMNEFGMSTAEAADFLDAAATRFAALSASREATVTPHHALQQYSRICARGVICALPGCGRTYFATGARLLRCGGCRVTYYCSADCQRAAWRHGELPHKEVCGTLGELVDILGSRQRDHQFCAKAQTVLAESSVDVVGHLERLYVG